MTKTNENETNTIDDVQQAMCDLLCRACHNLMINDHESITAVSKLADSLTRLTALQSAL